jgi:catechol 2,3-dioxygenase-like lactoylglutathione lyase family enzyme
VQKHLLGDLNADQAAQQQPASHPGQASAIRTGFSEFIITNPHRQPGPWRSKMTEGSQPAYEIALAHFIVSGDVERSRRFYTEVLGGTTVRSGEPTYVALANSSIIINVGGGPTDDKPAVTLQAPRDPDLASSFLNIRVSDIHAVYADWSARGAEFLTPPKQHKTELRCYMRDPDGYLIEVGQTTLPGGWRQFVNP